MSKQKVGYGASFSCSFISVLLSPAAILVLSGVMFVRPELLAGPLAPLNTTIGIAVLERVRVSLDCHRPFAGDRCTCKFCRRRPSHSRTEERSGSSIVESVNILEIFSMIKVSSLFSFGGRNGQMPVVQGQWVEPGILAPGLFSFALAWSLLA